MNHPESQEQQALFTWAQYAQAKYPELELLHHIPNGGKRDKLEAVRLKREGVKAGVPDVCLPVPRDNFHGLYIEMKANGGKPTQNQKWWISALIGQGYKALVCDGWEEAKAAIERYLEEKETSS